MECRTTASAPLYNDGEVKEEEEVEHEEQKKEVELKSGRRRMKRKKDKKGGEKEGRKRRRRKQRPPLHWRPDPFIFSAASYSDLAMQTFIFLPVFCAVIGGGSRLSATLMNVFNPLPHDALTTLPSSRV